MSVLCGQPTPTGPCRRPIAVPGGPCGVTHPALTSPTGAPPSGTPVVAAGPDPLLPGPAPDAGAAPQVLAASLDHLDWQQRLAVASDPLTHPDVLARLVAESDHLGAATALRNPSCPPGVLSRVAAEGETGLRVIAAAHPNTPLGVLASLAGDPNRLVRKAVAANPASRPETLTAVDAHRPRHPRVDAALAANPNTPPGVLAELAASKSVHVRQALAANPNTPAGVIEHFARSQVPLTRSLAEAGHPGTSPARLAELAGDDAPQVRQRVAARADLPAGTLAVLANDDHGPVAAAARANPAFTDAEAAHAGLLAD